MRIKRKLYTVYDDTDNLKRMKDADILAEKPRSSSVNTGAVVGMTGAGAALGGTLGSVGAAFTKNKVAGSSFTSKVGRGGKTGLLIGGLAAGGLAAHKFKKQSDENKFYNNRLQYAQKQARRREKSDWKSNMTQREGYSY